MPRARLSQERSRHRREALLEAAVRVFAEGGIRAVTHRAVAAEAGLPLAATTYYFSSIEELVREAIRHHVGAWIESLQQLTDVPIGVEALVDLETATQIIEAVFDARGADAAALELSIYLHAARDPELRDEACAAIDALATLMAGILERAGVDEPQDLVAAVTAQIAGVALRRQCRPDDPTEARRLARFEVAQHLLRD
ncbi:TetR/AcrR family transcriptional regulator, partial [uncultured Aeromicrobium sp.]|uniref:TetR/AcrR family transcriptional regulator n=1 Tax=uncultured Aeromicrobium sp. TaxID=337820 RepID=UPI0025D86F2A